MKAAVAAVYESCRISLVSVNLEDLPGFRGWSLPIRLYTLIFLAITQS